MKSALQFPQSDPTPIADLYRGNFAAELLVAAVHPFNLFHIIHDHQPLQSKDLAVKLGLQDRPFQVLCTALQAMNLIQVDANHFVTLPTISQEHLIPGGEYYMGDYLSLMADTPGVQNMITRLQTNRPLHAESPEQGAAFIFKEGLQSAMELEQQARHLTLALSGRAKNVAPYLAAKLKLSNVTTLLDIGGGTGIYSIACLQKNPHLHAIIWDRPEVLKIAKEFAEEYGTIDRMEFVSGDMFQDPLPGKPEAILLSNILHDWDVPDCIRLLQRCHGHLNSGDRVIIHDVFLNNDLSGPLSVALYSAALFNLTEGRAYSALEYQSMFESAHFQCNGSITDTLVHCGYLEGYAI